MSKEFKPIHDEHGNSVPEKQSSGKSISQQLLECKEAYEELRKRYENEVSGLIKEKEELLNERNRLSSELKELKEKLEILLKEKESLIKELEDIRYKEKLINEVCNAVKDTISSKKFDVSREMADMAIIVLKRLVLSDYIPHEELINRVLSEIFDRSIELYGHLNVYVSKEDIVRVESSINLLKSSLPELSINLLVDESLKEGEVRVETPKYWIERKYDDIIEDIIDEVLNSERDTSDLREGS